MRPYIISEEEIVILSEKKKSADDGGADQDDDFENCKGRCGYTIWCRECMKERETAIRAQEEAEFRKRQELESEKNSD